jgi:16S rRNA C1402 N4-methylase RsmH
VMRAFREWQKEGLGSATRQPITASLDEVVRNARSRSARLRTFRFN